MSAYRTTRRFIIFEIALSEEPIVYQYSPDSARILVETVLLEFEHDSGGVVSKTASLIGPYFLSSGKLSKSPETALVYFDYNPGPAWLQKIVEEHRPDVFVERRGPISGGAA